MGTERGEDDQQRLGQPAEELGGTPVASEVGQVPEHQSGPDRQAGPEDEDHDEAETLSDVGEALLQDCEDHETSDDRHDRCADSKGPPSGGIVDVGQDHEIADDHPESDAERKPSLGAVRGLEAVRDPQDVLLGEAPQAEGVDRVLIHIRRAERAQVEATRSGSHLDVVVRAVAHLVRIGFLLGRGLLGSLDGLGQLRVGNRGRHPRDGGWGLHFELVVDRHSNDLLPVPRNSQEHEDCSPDTRKPQQDSLTELITML